MKNTIIKLMIFTAIATVLNSCTKQLDLNPVTEKNAQNFLRTETEVDEYINSVYGGLQANGLYGLYLPAMAEISSDNSFDEIPANDGAIYGDLDQFKTIPANDMIESNWAASYRTIQRTNMVLNRIVNVSFTNQNTKNARIGEMKFIRALLYFNLVRLYGDVPLSTQETSDPNLYFGQGKQSTQEVYQQIIKDLAEAIPLLPPATSQQGRVIKTAGQTLLAKVYLTQKNYTAAQQQLNEVINSKVHQLETTVQTVFALNNKNNKEIIFAVQFASGINGNTEGSSRYQQFSPSGKASGAKGHNLPTIELYNLYTATDDRKGEYVDITATGVPFDAKIKAPRNVADGASNFVVLRYADVLLMKAEVENELNNTQNAKDALNIVRNRAKLPNTTANTKTDLAQAIATERRLELVGEGHRWFDLLRTETAIAIMNTWFTAQNIPITISQNNLLLPIPQSQINTDPTITQNTGY